MSGHLRAAFLVTLLLLVLVIHVPNVLTSPLDLTCSNPNGVDHQGHHVKDGKRGAVASESAICSRQGIDILELGGNAADAVSSPSFILVPSIGEHQSRGFLGSTKLLRCSWSRQSSVSE
jgi:gamma-glutamyltranspeptidase/glutathione hydrolase